MSVCLSPELTQTNNCYWSVFRTTVITWRLMDSLRKAFPFFKLFRWPVGVWRMFQINFLPQSICGRCLNNITRKLTRRSITSSRLTSGVSGPTVQVCLYLRCLSSVSLRASQFGTRSDRDRLINSVVKPTHSFRKPKISTTFVFTFNPYELNKFALMNESRR